MKKHAMAMLICVAALTASMSAEAQKPNSYKNAALQNIATRTSVRSYLEKPVDAATVEKLLRAGMAAPTAVNRQPWHFVVVNEKSQLEALSKTNPYSSMLENAPLAIVVCGDMKKALEGNAREFWVQDCSAATENILLAANALGLGAVWTGAYPSEERCSAISEVLKLPENLIPLNIIVIGYPDGVNEPKDKWKPENISYNVYGGKQRKEKERPIKESDFVEFDYTQTANINPFTWFKGAGLLLACGEGEDHNAMTIGWGALGNIWQHDISTITVYVAPARYTFEYMERFKYFTVMVFEPQGRVGVHGHAQRPRRQQGAGAGPARGLHGARHAVLSGGPRGL